MLTVNHIGNNLAILSFPGVDTMIKRSTITITYTDRSETINLIDQYSVAIDFSDIIGIDATSRLGYPMFWSVN